jgi:hypothetical protein
VKPLVALLLFISMAMCVNHQQDKNNQPADQEDDDDRLILPYHLHKIGDIGIHSLSIYIRFHRNLIRGAMADVSFEI